MEVIDAHALPARLSPLRSPVCVIVTPATLDRLDEVARWLGADSATAELLMKRMAHRRALAIVEGNQISVLAFTTNESGVATEVHLHAGEGGLLVICPEAAAEAIKHAVTRADGAPEDALLAALLVLARQSIDTLEHLADAAETLDERATGLISGEQRREISRLRSLLFSVQQLWTTHQQMLAADDILAEGLSADAARRLRRVRGIFESSTTAAAQLYALLGDTQHRQATVISERLTLVTVIFLPLTLSTGFFGMNFGWMTDHIGSAAAFVLLGIGVPVVLLAVTLLGTRRLAGD
jgi:Mg2+ and Co2+ transporter CorA